MTARLIDSTVVRAHPCVVGAEGSSAEPEALGRSRGGFRTKIHAVTDALGNPRAFVLTGGQTSQESLRRRKRRAMLNDDYRSRLIFGDQMPQSS